MSNIISPRWFTNIGTKINRRKLNYLRYSDDVVIIEELQTILTVQANESENGSKTDLRQNKNNRY